MVYIKYEAPVYKTPGLFCFGLLPETLYRLYYLFFRHYARLPPEHFAVLEKHERWDSLYLELRAAHQRLVLIDIHLYDSDIIAKGFFHFLKYRCQHLAGPAPCCEKIDKHRFFAVDQCIKTVHNFGFVNYKVIKHLLWDKGISTKL